MEKNKKVTLGTIIFFMIPVIAICAAVFFGYLYYKDFREYKEAEDEYADINENFIEIVSHDEPETEPYDEDDQVEEVYRYYPDLSIDFDSLKSINSKLACVLYIPALDITYPVAYSEDNEDYLHKTFEGKYNFAGCIFYDYLSDRGFTGLNTFIFGHNMKNGSMFGKLKKLQQETGLAASNPYFYIYTDNQIRMYEIFSYYQTVENSDTYMDVPDTEIYDTYINYCKRNSRFQEYSDDIDFTERPGLVTLSTCAGRAGGNERFVVHGALVAMKNPKHSKNLKK